MPPVPTQLVQIDAANQSATFIFLQIAAAWWWEALRDSGLGSCEEDQYEEH